MAEATGNGPAQPSSAAAQIGGTGPDEVQPASAPLTDPPGWPSGSADGSREEGGWRRPGRRADALLLPLLLVAGILVVLLPAVLIQGAGGVALLKLAVAGLLSFLPGWLYLQFIKNKGQTVYDEYVLNLFRLHIDEYRNLPAPPQHTSYYRLWEEHHNQLGPDTKDNLYRKKFEAIYGKSSVSTFDLIYDRRTVRTQTETFAPVLFATLLVCLGWVLVLQPEPWTQLDVFRGLSLSGQPQLPNEVLRFGFLGAYSFILQDIIRRYFRDDLKTGAFIAGVARVVYVTLILTALQLVAPVESRELQGALGFMVGFFPQIGLQALQAVLAKPLGALIPTLRVQHPLSELDGLNIWYEARLAEEGIEDMQNLVSANLVDLMLRTRAPIARLVDWIDQAFLCLHLPTASDLGGTESEAELPRVQLRRMGIRTASDLERAWAALKDDPGFRTRVSSALDMSSEEAMAAIRSILQSLDGDANFWHVREFKRHDWLLADSRRASRRSPRPSASQGSDDAPAVVAASASDPRS